MRMVADHARGVRSEPRHQTRARRIADRLLAVGSVEPNGGRRESIQVRRMNVLRAVTSQFGTQVINRDEQYVWRRFGTRVRAHGERLRGARKKGQGGEQANGRRSH